MGSDLHLKSIPVASGGRSKKWKGRYHTAAQCGPYVMVTQKMSMVRNGHHVGFSGRAGRIF